MLMQATHNEPAQQEPASADLEVCPNCNNNSISDEQVFCSAECERAYAQEVLAHEEALAQELCEERNIAQQEEEK